MLTKLIDISKLRQDQTYQIRAMDQQMIQDYMELEKFRDPIQVRPISASDEYQIIDGFHRVEAARRKGWTEIEASIITGACDSDFLSAAARANTSHGKPLDRVEKESLCKNLLQWLERDGKFAPIATVAKNCGLSSMTVAKYREELVKAGKLRPVRLVTDSMGRKRSARNRSTRRKHVLLRFTDASLRFLDELAVIDGKAWERLDQDDCDSVSEDLTTLAQQVQRILALRQTEPSDQEEDQPGSGGKERGAPEEISVGGSAP